MGNLKDIRKGLLKLVCVCDNVGWNMNTEGHSVSKESTLP